MKATLCLSLAIVLMLSVLAQAQVVVQTPGNTTGTTTTASGWAGRYDYFYSSTLQEGIGRGIGQVWRAKGEYNRATAEAAINFAEARRRETENHKQWVQTYFDTREINRQAREADLKTHRGSADDWARLALASRPRPLSAGELDSATGKIRWPDMFRSEEFAAYRAQVEKAFADRAYHGMMGSEARATVAQATDQMLASLKSHIHDMPASDYMQARRFITGLAYEATQPIA